MPSLPRWRGSSAPRRARRCPARLGWKRSSYGWNNRSRRSAVPRRRVSSPTRRGKADLAGDRHYTGDRAALGRFETFFFAAISTVVLVRAFLIVTGYPKVGGHGLHVAHVLWGGLLMGAAIAIAMIYPGSRWRHRAAIIGGVGFGLFIDEVGKFLTSSVNYFYKPAIAIIYVVFVAFYLVVRELVMRQPLSQPQRLAIASTALADLSLGQLGSGGRAYALGVLDSAESDVLGEHLRSALLC